MPMLSGLFEGPHEMKFTVPNTAGLDLRRASRIGIHNRDPSSPWGLLTKHHNLYSYPLRCITTGRHLINHFQDDV